MPENTSPVESTPPVDRPPETVVWRGSSSQVKYLGVYILCLLFCWLVVPIFIALWKFLENRSRVYEITTERIRRTAGIFSKVTEEIELYRVVDIKVVQPFWLRLFGLGSVTMTTNDVSAPNLTVDAVPDVHELREHLRRNVEICRDRKHVRVTEME
jgi:uncharacterized membrane protein YdbT with pleckstrin-like domain